MDVQEKILTYLFAYGKENKYRLARALKIDVSEVTEALDVLEKDGKIEIKEGNAIFVKGKKPIAKAKKQIQPTVEVKEEQPKEEEKPSEEKVEEKPEETKEETAEEITEEKVKEKRIEGSVKFFNPNKGFGFITGDDGKEYYVNESGLKEGVTIDADDRISFKAVEGVKGPIAEDVEKINQSVEE